MVERDLPPTPARPPEASLLVHQVGLSPRMRAALFAILALIILFFGVIAFTTVL